MRAPLGTGTAAAAGVLAGLGGSAAGGSRSCSRPARTRRAARSAWR